MYAIRSAPPHQGSAAALPPYGANVPAAAPLVTGLDVPNALTGERETTAEWRGASAETPLLGPAYDEMINQGKHQKTHNGLYKKYITSYHQPLRMKCHSTVSPAPSSPGKTT